MRLEIFIDNFSLEEKLHEILVAIQTLQKRENQFMTAVSDAFDALSASVARQTTVTASALTLIQGFSAQLAAAGSDPTKLAALKATVDANDDALAAAVAANTPAASPTPTA